MLILSGICKAFGHKVLFNDATLQVNRKDRVGLVGPNGTGKTTLFGIILGQQESDLGEITLEKNINIGYLPQESAPVGDETIIELSTAITPEFSKLYAAIINEHQSDIAHNEFDDIHGRFEELGGYQVISKAQRILSGLGFKQSDFDRKVSELSGGWIMRVHLARLLVKEPDLLLLDEPTNHLDLESLLWFQDYLKSYNGAIMTISHDRAFLNHIVSEIVEIRQAKFFRYRGNYDSFLIQKQAADEQLLAAYKNQQKEIAKLQRFADRFRAKATKASQAQNKLKQIERMEKIEAPVSDSTKIKFKFPQPERTGQKVITLENVHHAYGENKIYQGINFEAQRSEKIVLVGPNGAGKSTLLKLLAGVITPQQGTRTLGLNVKAGYYSQYRVDMLNPSRSVLQEAQDTPAAVTEESVRTLLGSFLFSGDDVFKPVSVLSGGEKSRLALVKLLLDPPNLLLMDEPTTHLDMASIDALVYALKQFEGTLIFISHDIYFIKALGNKVLHINSGILTPYAGDYQYYLDKTNATDAQDAVTAGNSTQPEKTPKAPKPSTVNRKEQKRLEAQLRQAQSQKRKQIQQLENKIEEAEKRQAELTKELENPTIYEDSKRVTDINRELISIGERLVELTQQWESLSLELEKN